MVEKLMYATVMNSCYRGSPTYSGDLTTLNVDISGCKKMEL